MFLQMKRNMFVWYRHARLAGTAALKDIRMVILTPISERLPPKDLANDAGPHCLALRRAGLEDVRVLGLPPAEPDLKAQATVAHVLRHTYFRCLNTPKKSIILNWSTVYTAKNRTCIFCCMLFETKTM